MTRSNEQGKKKQISYVSEGICEVLLAKNKDAFKVIHTGLRAFTRNEHENCKECNFRFGQEGIRVVAPHVKAQRIELLESDFITMMNEDYPMFSSFSEPANKEIEKASMCSPFLSHFSYC